MKKSLFLALALTLISLFAVGQVFAGPHQPVPQAALRAASNSVAVPVVPPGLPAGSTLVLDIRLQVTNDEDSGFFGYWALLNYTKDVLVWQVPAGTFYAEVRYEGTWKTFKNAVSPGLGMTQERDGSGPMKGGYVATFAGTFNPGTQKVKGSIGTYDFAGTKADILLGTYGNGQAGPTIPFSVLSAYFPGYTNFAYQSWGWMYNCKDEKMNETWFNFDRASIGDILTE